MKDGGPAFPVPHSQSCPRCNIGMANNNPGMSLRQYYAGMALAKCMDTPLNVKEASKEAFRMADAMIEADNSLH